MLSVDLSLSLRLPFPFSHLPVANIPPSPSSNKRARACYVIGGSRELQQVSKASRSENHIAYNFGYIISGMHVVCIRRSNIRYHPSRINHSRYLSFFPPIYGNPTPTRPNPMVSTPHITKYHRYIVVAAYGTIMKVFAWKRYT